MRVQNFRAAAKPIFLVNILSFPLLSLILTLGRKSMKLRNVGYAVVVAATAVAFVIGSASVGEAKGKKKAAAAAPAPMGICIEADSATKYCAVKMGVKLTYVNKCTAK